MDGIVFKNITGGRSNSQPSNPSNPPSYSNKKNEVWYTPLKPLDNDTSIYFKKMTVIYGGSKTGKTTIVKHILHLLKDMIPIIFIIAPTNSSNNAFTGLVPDVMIKPTLDQEWLESLWERQNNVVEVYKIVNNVNNLKSLFYKFGDPRFKKIENEIESLADEKIKKINDCPTLESPAVLDNFAGGYNTDDSKLSSWYSRDSNDDGNNSSDAIDILEKKQRRIRILNLKEESLRKLYKKFIRNNKKRIESSSRLSDVDRIILKYLDLNPNILLLLDDCASQFKKWYKKCNVIKKLFYEGRHKFFTTIITAQDDKEIDSELRKNVMTNIFTSSQSAIANFDRSSNSYSKDIKNKANYYAQRVFFEKKPQDQEL